MAWDAGAITGTLGLDISGFAGGVVEGEGLMQTFGPMVAEFMENPLLGAVEAAKEAGEAIVEMGAKWLETINEVATHAMNVGTEALKLGVRTEFLSSLEEAGKRVNVSAESISIGLKFLNRNVADALEGNSQAVQGFNMLGISLGFLKQHLGDTEGVFAAVRAGLQQLPDAAERTRTAMALLGRGGQELIPLFLMTDDAMKDAIETARAFGAIETAESAKSAEGWFKVKAAWDDMWEGVKKALGESVIDYAKNHWAEFRETLFDIAEVMLKLIPAAVDAATYAIETLANTFASSIGSGPLHWIAVVTDAIGLTHNLAESTTQLGESLTGLTEHFAEIRSATHEISDNALQRLHDFRTGGGGGDNYFQVHLNASFDPSRATSEMVNQLEPKLRQQYEAQLGHMKAASQHAAVTRGVGGKHYVSGF